MKRELIPSEIKSVEARGKRGWDVLGGGGYIERGKARSSQAKPYR
jgi:hypothetical protein